ncbi:IPIL1 protein, partial [Rhinopomastus cyanomelas]|nr:IPIL1 protein [Rhinopomastus cyanomelas]
NSKKEPEEEEDDDNEDVEEVLHSDAIYLRRIQWPGLNLAYRSQEVMHLMGDLLKAYQECFTQRFSPLLQPAIGIGSAFEGWSPSGDDTVYQVLLPLKPCPGYEFHVELGRAEKTPARDGRIHVELECTCSRKKSLCSLHNPEEMIRKRRGSSFLESLCTDSYLNVQKTVVCFQSFVKSAWATLPQSHCYKVQLLPSGHSCKLKLQKASRRTIIIEMLMGMQLADSDIFLCSQDTGAAISSSTTWALSCAVAEMKFFRLASRQVPHGSCHLRCLYACTRIAQGTCFSTYIFKTVMMHLLATTPPSGWSMENFPQRLDDTMRYLHRCLQEKRLNHFCFGNENIPGGIVLPLAFREAQPPNLLQHLQDGDAHTESLQELKKL